MCVARLLTAWFGAAPSCPSGPLWCPGPLVPSWGRQTAGAPSAGFLAQGPMSSPGALFVTARAPRPPRQLTHTHTQVKSEISNQTCPSSGRVGWSQRGPHWNVASVQRGLEISRRRFQREGRRRKTTTTFLAVSELLSSYFNYPETTISTIYL